MSLRQAIRAKFRSEKDKEGSPSPVSASAEGSPSSSPKTWREFTEEDIKSDGEKMTEEDDTLEADEAPIQHRGFGRSSQASVDQDVTSFRDLEVFELQLTQLQEQLVAAAIENQHLSDELKSYKEKNQVNRILHDLEYERQRNHDLSQQVAQAAVLRQRRAGSPPSGGDSGELSGGWVDVADEATEECIGTPSDDAEPKIPLKRTAKERFMDWFVHTYYECLTDFTEDADPVEEEEQEADPLTVKKLKDNIKRFRNGAKPIFSSFKGFYKLLTWKTPSLTLTVFLVYMYSVWHGWLLPVVLFMLILRLFINYLKYRGWNINIAFLADVEDDDKSKESEEFKELGMSDKFNLVVQVAKTVQNTLGKLADNLEKIKNLLMWRQPEATLRLFLMLWVGFVLSCVVPGTVLFMVGGLYMGFKMFILEYIHNKFPRFKQRHDSTHQIWKKLPTDSQLEKRYQQAAIDRNVLHVDLNEESGTERTTSTSSDTSDFRTFCELFSLPATEIPLQGWRGGRRCALVNKDKSLTAAFKHGKLFLTRSFFCFERSKTSAFKNLVIPLADITKMEKAKPYSWMPGGGMSIEVTVMGQEKPYIFSAILNRDEVFDSLVTYGVKACLPWALEMGKGQTDNGSGKTATSPTGKSTPAPPTKTLSSPSEPAGS